MGRDTQMRGDGDRRGAGGRPMSRRVLLAAGGAVLLSSTAAAMTAEYDARAHSAGMQLRPAADGAAGRTSARASPPSSTRAGAHCGQRVQCKPSARWSEFCGAYR